MRKRELHFEAARDTKCETLTPFWPYPSGVYFIYPAPCNLNLQPCKSVSQSEEQLRQGEGKLAPVPGSASCEVLRPAASIFVLL